MCLLPRQDPLPAVGAIQPGPGRVHLHTNVNRATPLTIDQALHTIRTLLPDRVQRTVIQLLPDLHTTVLHLEAITAPRPAAVPPAVPTADPHTVAARPIVVAAHHAAAGADDKQF